MAAVFLIPDRPLNGSDGGLTYQLLRNNVSGGNLYSTAFGLVLSRSAISLHLAPIPVNTIAPYVVATMNGNAVITDPRPVNFSASNDGPKCGTTPAPAVILSATNRPGATYYWAGPYGALQTTTTNSTVINGLAGTFTYSVYAVINGCTTPTAPTQVTLYPIPPPATAGADQNLCSLTTTLNGNPGGAGFSGLWTQVSGPGSAQSQFQDPTAFNSQVSVTTPGTYVYQWSISGAPVCGVSADQVSVTYNIMPATGTVTVSSTSPRCSNDPPIIISLAGSQTGINYQLKINGANSGAPPGGNWQYAYMVGSRFWKLYRAGYQHRRLYTNDVWRARYNSQSCASAIYRWRRRRSVHRLALCHNTERLAVRCKLRAEAWNYYGQHAYRQWR